VRDLAATTPQGLHAITFYHPSAQEALLAAAEHAGAEVRRGARVQEVKPGGAPEVTFVQTGRTGQTGQTENGKRETATARLVVGADGRGSMVRKWGGFETKQDPDQQWLAGIFIEDTAAPMEYSVAAFNPFVSRLALMFPQGGGRAVLFRGAQHGAGNGG
jgi:2-polyprenyl-6-methoxyphenol hydroxylase-like FAD-dependent oxidoreductase